MSYFLVMAFLRIFHHRGTEGTENGMKVIFRNELGIVAAISVPPWWTLHILPVRKDMCLARHVRPSGLAILPSIVHYSVA